MESNLIKPDSVRKAIMTMCGSLIIGVVRSVIEFPRMVELSGAVGGTKFVILVQMLSFGSILLWVYLINKRKNWALYALAIMTVVGTPMSVQPMVESFTNEPISGVLGIIQFVAQIIAIIMLFQKPSRDWFKKTAIN